jgi:hypothetical protein
MAALGIANEVRLTNATTLRAIKATPFVDGCGMVAAILLDPDEHQAAIPVGRLLLSIRRMGESRLARLLRTAGVLMPTKRVDALTERQRDVLVVGLRRMAASYYTRSAA